MSQGPLANSPYGDLSAGSVTGGCQIVNNILSNRTLFVRFWYYEGNGSLRHNDYTLIHRVIEIIQTSVILP